MHPTPLQTLASSAFVGEPTAYSLRTDDCVAIALVFCFLSIAWVVSQSRQFIADSIINLFDDNTRSSRFTKRATNELQSKPLLFAQTAISLGLVATCFLHSESGFMPTAVSQQMVLPAAAAIATVYYLLRIALYAGVNSVFFPPQKAKLWTDFYLLTLLFEGIILFTISLIVVYSQLSITDCKLPLVLLLGILEIPRIIKLKTIFFPGITGFVHIFLYFCTLNLAPLLLAVQILLNFNTQTT